MLKALEADLAVILELTFISLHYLVFAIICLLELFLYIILVKCFGLILFSLRYLSVHILLSLWRHFLLQIELACCLFWYGWFIGGFLCLCRDLFYFFSRLGDLLLCLSCRSCLTRFILNSRLLCLYGWFRRFSCCSFWFSHLWLFFDCFFQFHLFGQDFLFVNFELRHIFVTYTIGEWIQYRVWLDLQKVVIPIVLLDTLRSESFPTTEGIVKHL